MAKQGIHFVMMGGTIDSHYEGTKDTIEPNMTSAIPKYVNGLKLYHEIEFTEVCMKDSREVNEADLHKLLETIENSKHKKIIITHGTYTIDSTARYLKANLKRKDLAIIFTGAMVPLEFPYNDAGFNFGYTIAKIESLNDGIFVCMNGKLFLPEEVAKLISEGRFMSIFGEK